MDNNQVNDNNSPKNKSLMLWKILVLIIFSLLISLLVGAYLIINNNNKVLDSWKSLYKEEKIINSDLRQAQEGKNQEYESKINKVTDDYEKLQQSSKDIFAELTEERRITSHLLCNKEFYDFSDINFEYGGNTAMNRELKKFVENNILKSNEKITGATWDPIWNNVDVGMHKISITGNIRLYFITSFLDNEFGFKNSVYWIDGGCFLDFPNQ